MTSPPSAAVTASNRIRQNLAVLLAIAVTAGAYLWTLSVVTSGVATRTPNSHYGFLTDALLSGQLSLKIQPDPLLLKLANPYMGTQDVPRLHDASLYHGRYYLYFGPAPVVVLLGPWRLLTGTFLHDGTATVIFAFAGFLAGTWLWVGCQRRYFPTLAAGWLGAGVLMLGLGNYVFFLIQTPLFYQVPISCAYACLMFALAALAAAVGARTPGRQALGLALSGLAWALAIGARADYVFSLPAFGAAVLALSWRAGRAQDPGERRGWLILAAAAVPVLAVGSALAAYNWARFGSILETGIKYQLASADERFVTLASFAHLPAGLRAYLLGSPNYLAYFPFFEPSDATFATLACAPFALAALGFPLTLLDPARRRDRTWVLVGGAALLAALLNFLAICMYWFLQDRYALDFIPAAVLLALPVTAAALVARSRWTRGVGVALAAAGAVTLANSAMDAMLSHPNDDRPLARLLDYPAAALDRILGTRSGPLQLTVKFPRIKPGVQEPLVAMADGADLLYLIPTDEGHARIGFFHRGAGGPIGEPIAIDHDRPHVLDVDLGGLYPPRDDPRYRGWSDSLIDSLRRRLKVQFDGRTVLSGSSDFYPNDPWHTSVGSQPIPNYVTKRKFAGTILEVRHGGLPNPADLQGPGGSGPVRLTVQFPKFVAIYSEPLVCTGRGGAGDLLYVTYLAPGLVRFGHDCWNYGPLESPPVAFRPDAEQVIEIDMGSLSGSQAGLLDSKTRLQIRFNGRLVVSAYRPFHPTLPIDVTFGYNAIGASTANASFSGPEFKAERIPAFPDALKSP
jgi:hypothetical protein